LEISINGILIYRFKDGVFETPYQEEVVEVAKNLSPSKPSDMIMDNEFLQEKLHTSFVIAGVRQVNYRSVDLSGIKTERKYTIKFKLDGDREIPKYIV